ncbi:MAG: hypothetical protein AAB655_01865 [Patescibacteria group bacterium]
MKRLVAVSLLVFVLGFVLGALIKPSEQEVKSIDYLEELNHWYKERLDSQVEQTRKICNEATFLSEQVRKYYPSYPLYGCEEGWIDAPTTTLEYLP